jgi:hypothetical protein
MRSPIPLRPDASAASRAAFASIARNLVARAECALLDQRLSVTQSLAQRGWEDDRTAELLTRATSSPAKTSTGGWAQEIAHVGQALLRSLAPASAAAQLLESCLSVSLDGRASIGLPNIAPRRLKLSKSSCAQHRATGDGGLALTVGCATTQALDEQVDCEGEFSIIEPREGFRCCAGWPYFYLVLAHCCTHQMHYLLKLHPYSVKHHICVRQNLREGWDLTRYGRDGVAALS